jgi:hypothetical protein
MRASRLIPASQDYLARIAGVTPNRHLPALLRTLPLLGYEPLSASVCLAASHPFSPVRRYPSPDGRKPAASPSNRQERAGLHPLIIPVGRPAAAGPAREGVLGLLRLPAAGDGDSLPLVRVEGASPCLRRRFTGIIKCAERMCKSFV